MLPCIRKKSEYISTAYFPRGSRKLPWSGVNVANRSPVTALRLAADVISPCSRFASPPSGGASPSSSTRREPGGTQSRSSTSWCSSEPPPRCSLNWSDSSFVEFLPMDGMTHCETLDKSSSKSRRVLAASPSPVVCSTTRRFSSSTKCLPRFTPADEYSRPSSAQPAALRSAASASLSRRAKPSSLSSTSPSALYSVATAQRPKTDHVARATAADFVATFLPSAEPPRPTHATSSAPTVSEPDAPWPWRRRLLKIEGIVLGTAQREGCSLWIFPAQPLRRGLAEGSAIDF
mmetsp:Transcript_16453/g.49542  ORF Transcript_16453/g.49542 Transcript_16453/m.49542 type:complete len:290 (+) Transcript_16453:1337-2206(+)